MDKLRKNLKDRGAIVFTFDENVLQLDVIAGPEISETLKEVVSSCATEIQEILEQTMESADD